MWTLTAWPRCLVKNGLRLACTPVWIYPVLTDQLILMGKTMQAALSFSMIGVSRTTSDCPLVCQCSLALSEHPRSVNNVAVEVWHGRLPLQACRPGGVGQLCSHRSSHELRKLPTDRHLQSCIGIPPCRGMPGSLPPGL